MAEPFLVVLLDDVLAGFSRVRMAEGRDPEPSTHRSTYVRARYGDAVQLVEGDGGSPRSSRPQVVEHDRVYAAGAGTRSSRFSPLPSVECVFELTGVAEAGKALRNSHEVSSTHPHLLGEF